MEKGQPSRNTEKGRPALRQFASNPSYFSYIPFTQWASLIAQLVKNPPAKKETLVQFLAQEDPLGEGTGYPLQYSWASTSLIPLTQWLSGRVRLQCRRRVFNPWARKIPWRKAWQPTPVFLPGKSHGQKDRLPTPVFLGFPCSSVHRRATVHSP